MNYGITSADKIIDKNSIVSASKKMRDLAQQFETIGKNVKEAGAICSTKALAIDNCSFSKLLEEIGNEIIMLKALYQGLADELIWETDNVYYSQQREYQNYLNEQNKNKNKNSN